MASANSFLTFSSASPTNLLKISGPFTILGGLAFNTLANYLAIKVLPVPGGPYNKRPLTCLIPYFSRNAYGNLLDENALLNILANSLSKPPTPNLSKEKSSLNILAVCVEAFFIFNWFTPYLILNSISVSSTNIPPPINLTYYDSTPTLKTSVRVTLYK